MPRRLELTYFLDGNQVCRQREVIYNHVFRLSKSLGKGFVPCQVCFKSTIEAPWSRKCSRHSLRLWVLPANSAAPWKLVELSRSWVWLVAKGRAQMVSTVGVQKAGRPTIGSEEGAERRLREARSPDQEGIIHSTTIDRMFRWAGRCAESYRHVGERVTPVNCVWLRDSHGQLGSYEKAGSRRIQSEVHSEREVSPEFCFGECGPWTWAWNTWVRSLVWRWGSPVVWIYCCGNPPHPYPLPQGTSILKRGRRTNENFPGSNQGSQLFVGICAVFGGRGGWGLKKVTIFMGWNGPEGLLL